jgi:membrane protein DedA with SNARE-associated domain
LHSKRRQKVERHFAQHGNLTVLAGRFMPGLRSLVFGMAGMSRMTYLRFLILDGLAALVSVPLFIIVGYRFADKLDWLFARIDHIKHFLIPCLLVLAAGAIALYFIRRNRLLRQAADTPL